MHNIVTINFLIVKFGSNFVNLYKLKGTQLK